MGYGVITYPAPFDQPFYLILNLAVGGERPGYPDESTVFGDNAQLWIDYVRVYQKEKYDEDVEKPVTKLREADETGNLIINGNFYETENLDDSEGWAFILVGTGEAELEIKENALHIAAANPGEYIYSVQAAQAGIPLLRGNRYRFSFDAYASEPRSMIVCVTSPDRDSIRYLENTQVGLTAEKQNFSYELDESSDIYTMSDYLIAQLGKNYTNGVNDKITGKELVELAWTVIEDAQYMLGGIVTFLEAENEEKLLAFYRNNCFSQFDTRQTTSDTDGPHELVQLLRLL